MSAFKSDYTYNSDLQILDVVMYLFSKTVLKKELSPKQLVILREYLLNGYTPKVKDNICLNLGMNKQNLNTQNCKLQAMGFLHPHPRTQRLKIVDEELIKLRDCFLNEDSGKKLFIVNFIR